MGLKVHSEIILIFIHVHVHVAHLFNYLVWELRNNWSMGYLHLFTRWPFADDISNSTSLCLIRGAILNTKISILKKCNLISVLAAKKTLTFAEKFML